MNSTYTKLNTEFHARLNNRFYKHHTYSPSHVLLVSTRSYKYLQCNGGMFVIKCDNRSYDVNVASAGGYKIDWVES